MTDDGTYQPPAQACSAGRRRNSPRKGNRTPWPQNPSSSIEPTPSTVSAVHPPAPGHRYVSAAGARGGASLESWPPLLEQSIVDLMAAAARGAARGGTRVLPWRRGRPGVGQATPGAGAPTGPGGTVLGLGGRAPKPRVARVLLSTRRHHGREAAERDLPMIAGGRPARDPAALQSLLNAGEGYPPTMCGCRYQQWDVIGRTSWPWLHRLSSRTRIVPHPHRPGTGGPRGCPRGTAGSWPAATETRLVGRSADGGSAGSVSDRKLSMMGATRSGSSTSNMCPARGTY